MTHSELHAMPEVPAVAYFCSLFQHTLGTSDFEIQDLEDALVLGLTTDDMFCGSFLDNLLVSLLQGCLPMYSSTINISNYNTYLKQLITSKVEEWEEEEYTESCPIYDPFDEDREEFTQLEITEKVKLLKQLTEFRLEAEDVADKIKGVPVESLRLEPLGEDSNGALYWYFYGTRLYKEVIAKPETKEKKPKPSDDNDNGKKKKKKEKDEEGSAKKKKKAEPKEEGLPEAPGWYLVCQTENDWNTLAAKLKKTKKKADKELYQVIEENFLPEVVKMFQDKEREEKLKIMMMNKRTSSRIDRKKKEQEERDAQIEAIRKKEEEKRAKEERERILKEKENKLKAREERSRQREEKQIVDWKADRAARASRRLQEDVISEDDEDEDVRQRLHEDQGEEDLDDAPVEKRTRLDVEWRRREVERDHDYTIRPPSESRRNRPSGRKPASAEWSRLADDDSHIRSIRF